MYSMMNIVADRPDGWGERRVAERGARRRWRGFQLIGATVLIATGVPFLRGVRDGFLHRPADPDNVWEPVVAILAIVVVGGLIAWRNWRELDEVERRMTLNVWAAFGVVGFLAQSFLPLLAPALHIADPLRAAWWLSVAAGGGMLLWQKVRA